MSVAVVVPVLDEADNIGALLAVLRAQQHPAAEVVVVDAGSSDGTPEIVADLACEWPQLRLVHRPGATPGAGRNAGIAASGAALIATVDAGSRVEPGWLAALVAPVVHDPGTAAAGVAVPDARSSFERAAGWFTLRAFKPPDAPGPAARDFLPAGRTGLCFTRAAWTAAGGYPDRLPWGEDKRFVTALRAAGIRLEIAPAARVRWRPRTTPAELYRQYERYGRGDALARIDRQNELIPFGMMAVAGLLAARAARGDHRSGAALALAASGYLGLFTAAAARELRDRRAVAWVPAIRLLVDVAKVHGFLAESARPRRLDV
jgi:glycosyltransferase involved in cell wall biosynthesis